MWRSVNAKLSNAHCTNCAQVHFSILCLTHSYQRPFILLKEKNMLQQEGQHSCLKYNESSGAGLYLSDVQNDGCIYACTCTVLVAVFHPGCHLHIFVCSSVLLNKVSLLRVLFIKMILWVTFSTTIQMI